MTPQEYKGKAVTHAPSGENFIVSGGKKKKTGWFLKDELENLYPIDECQLVQINALDFDVRKLKSFVSARQFSSFCQQVGKDRFTAAWAKLDESPVEAAVAAIAAEYCVCWEQFCQLAETYEVSKELSLDLNQQFRALLKAKNLDGLIAQWYQQSKSAELISEVARI